MASLNEANIDLNKILPHFATFSGMGRRLQHVGNVKGAVIYDDYAHHPTEIKATLSALSKFKDKNIIAVFQPHRFSRLKSLWNDFKDSFEYASEVIVTDVYAASEDKIEGITGENFAKDLLKESKKCQYISGSVEEVAKAIYPQLTKNDIVVGLGAGTITNLSKSLINIDTDK